MIRIGTLATAGAVAALALSGGASARADATSGRAITSSTVCEIVASSTAERAAKLLKPRMPAGLRASVLLPIVVGGAIEFCPDLAPKASNAAKSLYGSLFAVPRASAAADRVPPAVLGPDHGIPGGWQLGTDGSLPVKAYWLAFDASRLNRVGLIVVENGRRRDVALPGAYSALATQVLYRGSSYGFGVRAVDTKGNAREKFGATFVPTISDEYAARISTGWTRVSDGQHFGGTVLSSANPSAWATFAFTGSSVALIAPRWSGGGTATVRIDGNPAGSVGLYAARFSPRQLVFGWRWYTPGRHVIEIRPTNGQAAIDGLVVLA